VLSKRQVSASAKVWSAVAALSAAWAHWSSLRDAESEQRLAAACRRLDPAQQDWLVELIELVTRRPARLEPPAG
jgi:hypothetical protein